MHSTSQLSNKLPVKNENEPLSLSITAHLLNLRYLTVNCLQIEHFLYIEVQCVCLEWHQLLVTNSPRWTNTTIRSALDYLLEVFMIESKDVMNLTSALTCS